MNRRRWMMRGSGVAPMVTLPQNLLTTQPTLLENFETIGDWTADSGTIAADTTYYKVGSKSVKQTTASGGQSDMHKHFTPMYLTGYDMFAIWVYLPDPVADYNFLKFYLYGDAGYNGFAYATKVGERMAGWNLIYAPRADMTLVNAGDWGQLFGRMVFSIKANTGKIVNASWDGFYIRTHATPAILLTFDDQFESTYAEAYSYMKSKGIRGTFFVCTDNIDDPTNVTSAQLQEMYANGWDIGNHTTDHSSLSTLSEADQETNLAAATAQLDAWGFSRSSKHVAYPTGLWNGDTMTAMTNLGMLTGRAVVSYNAGGRVPGLPPYNIYQIEGSQIGSASLTLILAKAAIDDAIAQGNPLITYAHNIGGDTPAGEMTVADFQALIDYVYLKAKAGLIYPLTIDDYYKLTLGPVSVPRTP